MSDLTSPVLDLDAVRAGKDFAAELVSIADDLAEDPVALRAVLDDLASPLGASLPGFRPGVDPARTLTAARDAALDLLLADGGGRQ